MLLLVDKLDRFVSNKTQRAIYIGQLGRDQLTEPRASYELSHTGTPEAT
jgi:hypothetical protein